MPKEVQYPLAEARNELSAILRKVREGTEVAIITSHGKPVAKIIPHGSNRTADETLGMTKSQIQKALDATKDHPEMLRSMLELFI